MRRRSCSRIFHICILIVSLGLSGSLSCVYQLADGHELLYPEEIPAAFDALIVAATAENGDKSLNFQWSAENGTIRGEGRSVTWNAPNECGVYNIESRVISESGRERLGRADINVIPFYRTQVDPDPQIDLELALLGNRVAYEQSLVGPLTSAVINCSVPFADIIGYKYEWSCNGGKMQGNGIRDGAASTIGWISPGVPGNYTVSVKAVDRWGNIALGSVFFKVKNPTCCDVQDEGESFRWK